MDYKVGCDAHKHYSQFAVLDQDGHLLAQRRVDHQPDAIQTFLEGLPEGTPVALERVGTWAVYFGPLLLGRFDQTTLDLHGGYPFNKPM